ncbi:MAG: 3-dehydroquinate synthase [Verrucomicrobiaceae bacterium]|nr:3-dehydroquinate synthase [Verrucomicrobiaceae bacterium]
MLQRKITVDYTHRILFTRDAFVDANTVVRDLLCLNGVGRPAKVLVFIDDRVARACPKLVPQVLNYAAAHLDVMHLAADPLVIPGGEACKNDFRLVEQCWRAINEAALDRHSYVFVIGGGAVLDLVCFAASTAHRGIRHVRFPTTTLSQGDGGVGVKNGVNYFGKKNWVGSFAVPFAVVNDFTFLESLPVRERRNGIIEAIKVALIRDAKFFNYLCENAAGLAALDQSVLERVVQRSAELHVEHIATNGDPFEMGSARPLDFGHWAAHKLEQVSAFRVAHGEAVAIGMAVDLVYSAKRALISAATALRILALIEKVGFATYAPELLDRGSNGDLVILAGLEEFREHLGGDLTVTLVPEIGRKIEVHEMDRALIVQAVEELRDRANASPAELPAAFS